MRALVTTAMLVTAFSASGCLNQIIPQYDNAGDMAVKTAVGTPLQDLGQVYAADPTTDGGMAVNFALIQSQFDSLGCTTTACHGVTQQPVLVATPATAAIAKSNYYDLIDGCGTGTPDPADCLDTKKAANSLLLAKTCATSGVDHAGGKPFADDTAPLYQLWQGWIAAGAPY
jgi:hypothetical protein